MPALHVRIPDRHPARIDVDHAAHRIGIHVRREGLGDFERLHDLRGDAIERIAAATLTLPIDRDAQHALVYAAH